MLDTVTPRPQGAPVAPFAVPFRRVLLVNPPMAAIGAEFMMEDVPLRLEYLAAYIGGHVAEVEVLDLANGAGDLERTLRRLRPDLVGVSINYISTHVNGLALARAAKAFGAKVVVGGYQATAMADTLAAEPAIDWVARGEGEATLLELVQGLPIETIAGLTYARDGKLVRNPDRPLIESLDSIPVPDRRRRDRHYQLPFAELDNDQATAYDMIITSRGCWGRCTFCTEPMMSHGTQRYRSPEKILEELREIIALHRTPRLRVHIADPNFGGNPKIAEELCDRLIEFRKTCGTELHFFVSVRTNTIANNPRLTAKMLEAGFDYLFVGMESPRKEDLKHVSKGGESVEKQEIAVALLKAGGAEIMSNFLIGLPGQTPESILGLVEYAKKLELADCYFSVVTPLPGSKLYEESKAKGLLLEEDVTKYRLFDIVFKHDTLSRAQVREMCVRANAKWYDDLMLPAEHRRFQATGRRRRLYDFAGKFGVLVNFFTWMGSGADKEFANIDLGSLVADMPTPRLRAFTEAHPVHTFLDMDRFLRILGRQRLAVTLHSGGRPVVSWIAQSTPTSLDYLAAVPGAPPEAPTVAINVSMDPGALNGATLARRILADNASLASRLGLVRLAAAAAGELAAYYADRTTTRARTRATETLAQARTEGLAGLLRRLAARS